MIVEEAPPPQEADRDTSRDVHVIPCYGREHDSSPTCWCSPRLDRIAPETGRGVWIHREDN